MVRIRMTSPLAELRLGLSAWALFILATCAYCLVHQAFVSAVTPDVARTVVLALREWGSWAVLAPLALRMFRAARAPGWKRALLACLTLGLAGAALPLVIDQVIGARSLTSSLALFWPRNFAMALALLCVGRVFRLPAPQLPDVAAPSTLLVAKGADQCLIQIDDIQHVTAAGNYVDICARDQRYLLRATLADVQTLLPAAEFVRIHRSHIVRVREIERIRLERSGSGTVHLRGGGTLAISKGYRAQLKRHQVADTHHA
jgi:hypothetical protein